MDTIEVEIRSLISQDQYNQLVTFFNKNAKLSKQSNQETYYFDSKEDLRIQKDEDFAKIWLKTGKIHDEQREELEIKVDKKDFLKLEKLFNLIGSRVKIKWFRNRLEYLWDNICVCLDYTRGYGYIIELEKMSTPKNKDQNLALLKSKLKDLKIEQTSRELFDEKFANYKKNWRKLTKEKYD